MFEVMMIALPFVAFLVIFPLFWIAVVWLISRLSGWSNLAATYATDQPPAGETFGWVSARLRFFSNYSNCLTATVSGRGLHLAPIAFFKFGHAPLFFPWDAIVEVTPSRFLFAHAVRLRVVDTRGAHTLTLYGRRLAEALSKQAAVRLRK